METRPPKLNSESAINKTFLGQILVELGYVTIYQLEEALGAQTSARQEGTDPKPLGQILLELGYCSPNQLIRAIQVQVEYRDAQLQK
jgi:hypothetical protein